MFGLKKTHTNIIARFKKSSIFMSNLRRFLIMIAIPLIIVNILTAVYYYRSVSLESRMSSSQIFASTAFSLEKLYDETEEIYLALMVESGMTLFTTADDIINMDDYKKRAINDLIQVAGKYCMPSDGIMSIDVYGISSDYVLSTESSGPAENFKNRSWYGASSDDLCFTVQNGKSISLCYNIVSHKKKIGLMAFNITPSSVFNPAISPDKKLSMQLYDINGKVLFSSGEPMKSTDTSLAQSDGISIKMHNKYTEMSKRIYNVYLYMTIEHPQPLYSNFVLILTLFVLFVLILSVILAIILASYSYRSVQEIVLNVNDIEPLSDFSDAANEIMYINQNIINMKDKNQKLEEELLASFASLKVLQTQVLQSQFTPHFLFNALNTLNLSLMLKNGVDNPESKALIALSELLSESVDVKNYIIPMERELEYCRKYIDIQSYISNHNFSVEWNVSDKAKECIYIKFTLQPLIENAFKHGIKYLKNKKRGTLRISVRKLGNKLETCIENNGPAPTDEELNSINTMLQRGMSNDKNHVGLFNVNKRIQLVFGESYGCKMGVNGDFTSVTVTTPFVTDFNTDDTV